MPHFTLVERFPGAKDRSHTVSSIEEARHVASGILEADAVNDSPQASFTLLDAQGNEINF